MSVVPSPAIGEVVDQVPCWTPRLDDADGEFTYVDLSAIDQDSKTIASPRRLACADAPSRARQIVRSGDVLVSTVRPNLNAVGRVPVELDGATASTGFCVLRPRADVVDGVYLFHWARSPRFVGEMVRRATGASYPAVSGRIVYDSKIPLPPLDEQKRIAGILDAADALRAKRREALAELDTLLQSTFLEMFGDPVTNPMGWERKPLGEIIKVRSGDGLISKDMAPDGKYPVYGGNGISGYHDSFMFEEPRIVLGRVGVYCGAVHLTRPRAWVTDNALYVHTFIQPVDTTYLVAALKMANLNQYAGRSAQPLISGNRIYPVEILIPSVVLQLRFVAIVKAVEMQITCVRSHLSELDLLFTAFQSRAFRGQL